MYFNLESVPLSTVVLTLIVVIAATFIYNAQFRVFWHRCPGPWGIPFFGFYPFLRQDYYVQLAEMAKIYGDTYLFSLGGKLYVHLSSYKALREAHLTKSDCFAVRWSEFNPIRHLLGAGVPFQDGEVWRLMRKFMLHSLRELGLSPKQQLNDRLRKSLQATLNVLTDSKSLPIELSALLSTQCNEASQKLIVGDKTSREEITRFADAFYKGNSIMGNMAVLLMGNVVRYFILPRYKNFKNVLEGRKGMDYALHSILDDHKKNFDPENPKDFIDLYLHEKKIKEDNADPQAKYYTDEIITAILRQVYGDCGYGMGIYIAKFLKDLASNVDAQNEIYEEILREIGTERLPVLEDQVNLPFTVSAIKEIERMSHFFPVVPSVECNCDTTVSGVFIPKGTVMLVNVYAIHRDPEVYKDPDQFDPKRFMPDEKEKRLKQNLPVTFGIGKRSCVGESLIKAELFIFLTTIMQHFVLQLVESGSSENSEEEPTHDEVWLRAIPRSELSTNKL